MPASSARATNTAPLLGGPEIEHYHQAIALVVAETFEQARAAALVGVEYDRAEGAFDLAAARETAVNPKAGQPESAAGDFAAAFAAAPVQLDATYTTPDQAHAMMEPHASMAVWDGDKLTLWTSNQMIDWAGPTSPRRSASRRKMFGWSRPLSAAASAASCSCAPTRCSRRWARARPAAGEGGAQRPLMFNNTTHRPATIQRIRIGAARDGKITAIGHESWSGNLPGGKPETAVDQTRLLYAGANRMTASARRSICPKAMRCARRARRRA